MLFRISKCLIVLCVLILSNVWAGCLGNSAYRAGHPCKDDVDCKSAGANLFCGKDNLCVAEECNGGDTRTCFIGEQGCDKDGNNCKGACKAGTQKCTGGLWGACDGQVSPSEEKCDGIDNNCDGIVDNGSTKTGICALSAQKISDGAGGLSACIDKKESCTVDPKALCSSTDKGVCETTPALVYIDSKDKSFQMGTPKSVLREDDEGGSQGQVKVSFGYSYGIGQREITQKQFKAIMGYLPESLAATGDDLPVHGITWHEAAAYTALLSEKHGLAPCFTCLPAHDPSSGKAYTGKCNVNSSFADEQLYAVACPGFRLPTEAEWEYAYRGKVGGGLYRDFYNGKMTTPADRSDYADGTLDQIGRYGKNANGKPNATKGLIPNDWQLFDMSGNVGEWVFDFYISSYASGNVANENRTGPNKGTERVWRGGHYLSLPHECRGTKRNKLDPTSNETTVADGPNKGKSVGLGFRIAKTLLQK